MSNNSPRSPEKQEAVMLLQLSDLSRVPAAGSDPTPSDSLDAASLGPATSLALAASLTIDLFRASQATAISFESGTHIATFPDLPSAISASQRVEWALQGLAEASNSNTTAAIFIDTSPSPSTQSSLDSPKLFPGQILLSAEASRKLENIPVFVLRQPLASDQPHGYRELLWRASGPDATPAADHQTLLTLAQKHGLADHFPVEPEPAPPSPANDLANAAANGPAIENRDQTPVIFPPKVPAAITPATTVNSSEVPKSKSPASPPPESLPSEAPFTKHPSTNSPAVGDHPTLGRGKTADPDSANHAALTPLPATSPSDSPLLSHSLNFRAFSPSTTGKRTWLYVSAGGAAALILLIIWLAASRVTKPKPAAIPLLPNTLPQALKAEPAPPSILSAPKPPLTTKPAKLEPKPARSDAPTPDLAGKTSRPSASCTLNPSQYQFALDNAWSMYQLRKYAVARTGFNSVLACDRQNQSAALGLKRVQSSDRQTAPAVPQH